MSRVKSITGLGDESFTIGLEKLVGLDSKNNFSRINSDLQKFLEKRFELLKSISELSDSFLHVINLSVELENESRSYYLKPFSISRIFKSKISTPILLAMKRSLDNLQKDLERCVHDGDELLRKMSENSAF